MERGQLGYVIVNNRTVYFIKKVNVPKNIDWQNVPLDKLGHPADLILQGEAIDSIRANLTTGDEVEVWYSVVAQSYPGKTYVTKINKTRSADI